MDTHAVLLGDPSPSLARHRRLRVGVLVDLPLGPRSGGHVRCWERLAEAALRFPERLDLTVHFSGPRSQRHVLGESVRYVIEPPVFSTERLPFLSHVPDHTDLAPWHPRLARALPTYDVIHTTDAYFAYARTALAVGRRRGIPLVNSIHTDTPAYACIFTAQTIERLFGQGVAAHLLLQSLRVAHRIEAGMLRRLAAYQRSCAFAFVSRPEQLEAARLRVAGVGAAVLRRGIDHRMFHPAKRDRQWLQAAHGIPPERFTVICAGRLNRGKNVLLLAEAMATLIARGVDAQLVCAGEGEDRATILRRLGARATCPGNIDPPHLARLYAAADLFAFPSRIEESANVVIEALASGLPVLVSREGGMGRIIADGVTGWTLPAEEAGVWAEAAAVLAGDAERRDMMARAARRHAERAIPCWSDVLAEDLLPRWEAAARHHALALRIAA